MCFTLGSTRKNAQLLDTDYCPFSGLWMLTILNTFRRIYFPLLQNCINCEFSMVHFAVLGLFSYRSQMTTITRLPGKTQPLETGSVVI